MYFHNLPPSCKFSAQSTSGIQRCEGLGVKRLPKKFGLLIFSQARVLRDIKKTEDTLAFLVFLYLRGVQKLFELILTTKNIIGTFIIKTYIRQTNSCDLPEMKPSGTLLCDYNFDQLTCHRNRTKQECVGEMSVRIQNFVNEPLGGKQLSVLS